MNAPLAVGDHVMVREFGSDDPESVIEDEGVGIVRRVAPNGDVWVESVCNIWRGYPPEMFVKTDEPLSPGLEEVGRAVQPTVYGIRGHRVLSPEEEDQQRMAAMSLSALTAEQGARLLEDLG